MKNKFVNFMRSRLLWFLLPFSCAFAPLILFGDPGYYGDDFNMLGALKEFNGVWGHFLSWVREYGFFYRPFGILLLTSIYSLFGTESLYMYLCSFFIYFLWIYFLFKVFLETSQDKLYSGFIVLFFASFPFNATAFLQLSSMYMMLAGLLTLLLISYITKKGTHSSFLQFFFLSVLWLVLLLTYEQVTGLVTVIFLVILFKNYDLKDRWVSNTVAHSSGFLIITLVFMSIFFLSVENPKISVLEDLNDTSATLIQENLSDDSESESISKINLDNNSSPNTFSSSRFNAVISKLTRSSAFLYENYFYSIKKIVSMGWKGFLLFGLLILIAFFIFLQKLTLPTKKNCILYSSFGLIWFVATMAPFFLYSSVHIPPYVLLIPSVGLASFLYGIYWLMCPYKFKKFIKGFYKIALISLVLSFFIQQYGFYFGLKEELAFWEQMANKYVENEQKILSSQTIIIKNLPQKENMHIFWIERLYGHRHFLNLTKASAADLVIIYNPKEKTHSLSKRIILEK